jgi:hypothetical protein
MGRRRFQENSLRVGMKLTGGDEADGWSRASEGEWHRPFFQRPNITHGKELSHWKSVDVPPGSWDSCGPPKLKMEL